MKHSVTIVKEYARNDFELEAETLLDNGFEMSGFHSYEYDRGFGEMGITYVAIFVKEISEQDV